jgi:hypothetical protein
LPANAVAHRLQQVVHVHSIHDDAVNRWCAPGAPLGDGGEPEPEPEPERRLEPGARRQRPTIVGSVQRPSDAPTTATTYYLVAMIDQADETTAPTEVLERRYSDFLALKHTLKEANKERFSDVFPSKLNSSHRQEALDAWLRRVVDTHSTMDCAVADFLTDCI